MLIGRFSINNKKFYGILPAKGDTVYELETLAGERTGKTYVLGDLKILAPCEPTKIVCIGLNYRDHAAELEMAIPDEPIIFLKPPSAVTAHNTAIIYPNSTRRVDYEAELALVIGRPAHRVSKEQAPAYVAGYTCANDVTARDLQEKDGQWTRAKSFNTFLPLGPYINTAIDPGSLDISLYINNRRKQFSNTSNLIFGISELVSFTSHIMTLWPGDVILTGTPSGVGPMDIGDTVTVTIDGIGSLRNHVVE